MDLIAVMFAWMICSLRAVESVLIYVVVMRKKMNRVMIEHMVHLSEKKPRLYKIKRIASDWRSVVIVSVLALTLKTAAEQLLMLAR
jgi:hypothetical protein